jgi:hypothetical protein
MDIAVQADGNMLVRVINEECVKNKSFEELSAMRWGIWPLVMMACRHNRFPLPPNFWVTALPAASEPDGGAAVRL